MIQNPKYRAIAAYFLAALLSQVLILEGMHQYFGHSHHDEPCNSKTVHMHSEDHGHFSCDFCLFQFAPYEIVDDALSIAKSEQKIAEQVFLFCSASNKLVYLQAFLRGPPHLLA